MRSRYLEIYKVLQSTAKIILLFYVSVIFIIFN